MRPSKAPNEKGYLTKTLRIVYPRRCAVCGTVVKHGKALCRSCKLENQRIPESRCLGCGCGISDCSCSKRFSFSGIVAPFYFEGETRQAVHHFKFRRSAASAKYLACEMLKAVAQEYNKIKFDEIVCVPQTKKRCRIRGYNQSALLARELSFATGLHFDEFTLVKTRDTPDQNSLSGSERLQNVSGAFAVGEGKSVSGKTVLICDDVKTTGATLGECSRVLLEGGAEKVFCVVVAVSKMRNR